MTNDSKFFQTSNNMKKNGFWLGRGNIYTKGKKKYLPLYEGKMVQLYDHRAASIEINPANIHRPASPVPSTEVQHKDMEYSPMPQFWVTEKEVLTRLPKPPPGYFISFKNVASPTNQRTFIVSLLPFCGVGNSQPLILTQDIEPQKTACLLANLSAFVFDYTARQKVGGQNLNFFIVEQLPVLPPQQYDERWRDVSLKEFISKRVLELVFTSNDISAFARDMNYKGKPFQWDEERRLHLRCQLDALFFLLYEIELKKVSYILETFPIIKEGDIKQYGSYRAKSLIESYYNAYKAKNMEAWVKG